MIEGNGHAFNGAATATQNLPRDRRRGKGEYSPQGVQKNDVCG
jgi:hypothetical protein